MHCAGRCCRSTPGAAGFVRCLAGDRDESSGDAAAIIADAPPPVHSRLNPCELPGLQTSVLRASGVLTHGLQRGLGLLQKAPRPARGMKERFRFGRMLSDRGGGKVTELSFLCCA